MTPETPTPETDTEEDKHGNGNAMHAHCHDSSHLSGDFADFARRLERERDAARAEIALMREAIKEAHGALQMASLTMQTLCPVPSHEGHCGPESCCDCSCADASHFADKLERNDAALAKLQPYIK